MRAQPEEKKISLTKGTLEFILARAMGYAWNEANRDKKALDDPMEAYNNVQKERVKMAEYYFNSISTNQPF